MKEKDCINLNNHFIFLKFSLNEPNSKIASLNFMQLIEFYSSTHTNKSCLLIKLLQEYCQMWKALNDFAFIKPIFPS